MKCENLFLFLSLSMATFPHFTFKSVCDFTILLSLAECDGFLLFFTSSLFTTVQEVKKFNFI